MAKEIKQNVAGISNTKLNVNVGTIGHIDHGKTTLTAALLRVQSEKVWPLLNRMTKSQKEASSVTNLKPLRSLRLTSSTKRLRERMPISTAPVTRTTSRT